MNVMVLLPGVNVPPLTDQLPDTSKAPVGAVNVPEDKLTLVALIAPVDPVNVPPFTVNPPLKFCVFVDA